LVEITIIVVICLVFTVISDIRGAKKARAGWSTYRVALADQGLLTISMRTGVTRLMWDQMKCAVEFPRTLCIVTKSGQHLHIARSISAYPTLHSMVAAHIAIERSRAPVVRTVLLTPLGFALLAGPLMAQGLIRDVRMQFLCFGLLIVIHAVVNLRRWRRRILSTRSLNICVISSCVVILASAILLVLSMIAH